MKKFKMILIILILLMPTLVFASSGEEDIPLFVAIFMEVFVSIHMSLFVLKPMADMISPSNSNKLFWKLFAIRAGVLLFFDLITPNIAIIDFLAVFVGGFLVVPITGIFYRKKNATNMITAPTVNEKLSTLSQNIVPEEMKCKNCGTIVLSSDKFCMNCGTLVDRNIEMNTIKCSKCGAESSSLAKFCTMCGEPISTMFEKYKTMSPSDFDPIYSYSEDMMLLTFLKKEIEKAQFPADKTLIPPDILKRKKIFNIIISILCFVLISLIFFHCLIGIYILGAIVLGVFYILSRRFNLEKYLVKEVKSRPGEKISNIVMNTKNSLVKDNTKKPFYCSIVVAIILPIIFFMNPHIFYEKADDGYWVRFYTFGITNYKSVEIPSTHNGEPVIGLRGNAFSNMYFLEKVVLPDSILRINGQAFKNDYKLKDVKLPNNLEYLGGGSFYNCKSLTYIEIPDSVTEMGGETFYNAKSLIGIKLSQRLTEIRGNTFENCESLASIEIPDSVTRIGGHAFYGNTSLKEVTFTPNSKLQEIGSSAFRRCYNLEEIVIPKGVSINSRAFKESPTDIRYLGKIDLKKEIDASKYNRQSLIYFSKINDTNTVNNTYSDAIIYNNVYLTLVSVRRGTENYQFTFRYRDEYRTMTYVLNEDKPYVEISENLVLILDYEYIYKGLTSDGIYLVAYYN